MGEMEWRACEDSNLRPLDTESNGVPFYVVDKFNIRGFQF
jgi:hypothetical protein